MRFSHLFILQLRSWRRGLGPLIRTLNPFDLLIFYLLLLLLPFDLLLSIYIPRPLMLEPTLLHAQALQGNVTSFNLRAVQDLAASCSQASETHQDPSTGSASDC